MNRAFLLGLLVATGCVHADREHSRLAETWSRPSHAEAEAETEAEAEAETFDRRRMIAAYLQASPELHAFDAEVEARLARIDVAGTLEAPELMVQSWNIPFRRPYALDEASMWMAIVTQRFEPRGVRGDRVREASAEAQAVFAERASVALEVAGRAASDHAAIATLDQTLAARAATLAAYASLVTASEALVAGGRVDARMLVETRATKARIEAAIAGGLARRSALARNANVRMARPSDAPLTVVVDDGAIDVSVVRDRLANHPAFQTNDARIEAARARRDAAVHASRRPSVTAGLGVYEEPHAGVGYGFQVGLSLPWLGGRARAERRMADAELARAEAERSIAERGVAVELESALAELAAADAALRAIDETSLPALEASARATESGLASGATSVRDVIAVHTQLAELRLERAEWLGARLLAEASLQAWLAMLTSDEGAR